MDFKYVYYLVGAGAAAGLGLLLVRWLSSQRNAAGISTSMTARTAQLGGLMTKSVFRKLWLMIRQLVATHEHRKQLEEQYHLQTAEEATKMMGNMKGVFMKLGQIISFTGASLPEAARQQLQTLQKDSPPMAFALARSVIEKDLGGDLSRFFRHVDEEPLAAASIGQVHRATLKDGTHAVVKVQYPGVAEAIENDLKMSSGLAFMISAVSKNMDANAVVEELKARLYDELDYRQELQNQQLFRELWDGHPLIRIPRVFPEASGRHVLCQEYKRGLGFYDFLGQSTAKEKRLAALVLHDFVFDSMHLFHVFNGDPHPGNYIFHEDGGVTFLDFGCIKYFEPEFITDVQGIYRAIMNGDRDGLNRLILKLKLVLPGRPFDDGLKQTMWEFFQYDGAPFAKDGIFTYTQEYLDGVKEIMKPETLQQINLPADFLFFNRITFGLNAILQQLGASENFHNINRRYAFPEEHRAPALVQAGGIELPARFVDSAHHPARQVKAVAGRG